MTSLLATNSEFPIVVNGSVLVVLTNFVNSFTSVNLLTMAPKPAGKDVEYFTTLTSTFSLRKFPIAKWTVVRALGTQLKLDSAIETIEEHGTGADLEQLRDGIMVHEMEDIVRYFESKKKDLTVIFDNATADLKSFLTSGPPARLNSFVKFQEIWSNAQKMSRMKSAAKKSDARREFDAEIERIILSDDDNDVKLRSVRGLVAGYIAMATATSGYDPDDN